MARNLKGTVYRELSRGSYNDVKTKILLFFIKIEKHMKAANICHILLSKNLKLHQNIMQFFRNKLLLT